jgi:carboxyl-terminal processing protease
MNVQPSSKFEIRLPLLLALTLAAGMFIGQKLPHYESHFRFLSGSQANGMAAGALDEVLRYIEAKYVDTVDVATLKNEAISQVLMQLDPHSVYISPEELEQVEEDMNGNFEGIGIEFLVVDDTIRVITPLSGGPSEAAGIMAGDKIIRIDDSIVAGVQIDNAAIFKKLRGEKGSKVRIDVLRGRESKTRKFTISRDVIPVNSLEIAYMLDDQTGYVKINRFSARTHQEFMEAVHPLAEQGMKNLVLDLRGNPGGYLKEAVDILSQIFTEGKLLVYTQGRTEERYDYKSTGRAQFNIDKVAVLIDEGSASASEIIAGAVQDHDRGWLIGRRTFGKGLVQEQYPLSDGGALRLTVSRYYTPSGRSIQRAYQQKDKEYAHEADRRLQNGELADSSKIHFEDTTKYYTGMGRIVYAGGGISPDVFIPLDTSFANSFFFEARQRLPLFAAQWLDKQDRKALPQKLDDFIRNFQPSESDLKLLLDYLKKEGVTWDEAAWKASRSEIRHELKARIGKLLFKDEGLYRVLNDDDPAVEKAMQILRKGDPLVTNGKQKATEE